MSRDFEENDLADMTPVDCDQMPFDIKDDPPKHKIKLVNRRDIFEKLYVESDGMSKKARYKYLCEKMRPYFKQQKDADEYVEKSWGQSLRI